MLRKSSILVLACAAMVGTGHAADEASAILELGVSTSRSPWFAFDDPWSKKTLPGFTAAAAASFPLANKDLVAVDLQTEFHSAKSRMTPARDFGPTSVGLLSARYEKHFDNVLVAPFLGVGKANERDGGGIGHMFGLQAMSKSASSQLNFFGTLGRANFVADTDPEEGSSDGAFIGTFSEIGAITSFNDRFSAKATLGYGETGKAYRQWGEFDRFYEKGSYRSVGIKGMYQPQDFKNLSVTFGFSQQRYKFRNSDYGQDLSLKNTRFFVGAVMSFGGNVTNRDKLRPLAPTLDPLRASVYGEVADRVLD